MGEINKIRVGLQDQTGYKEFTYGYVPSLNWLIGYIKQQNRYGVRALALIHGGNNA